LKPHSEPDNPNDTTSSNAIIVPILLFSFYLSPLTP